jgi:predicted PurR-regulated permease PerM
MSVRVGQKSGQRYLDENGPMLTRVFTWILGVIAYLAMLTDRLPTRDEQRVRFEVERSGSPTVGSTLLRILYSIPSLIVLAILVFVGAFVWLLVNERYPESAWRFLCGLVRWEAYLFAYLASLTDRYPPFTLETGSVSSPAPSS